MQESTEDYLEAILMLKKQRGVVRSIDIAGKMNVSKASVSVAMKNLRNAGYICVGQDHAIFLTPRGQELAEAVYERHMLFSGVLTRLGVEKEVAARDACHMEHAVSPESFEALKRYFMGCRRIAPDKTPGGES